MDYVKISRKILDWEWYTDINTKVLFLHILLKAKQKAQQPDVDTITRERDAAQKELQELKNEKILTGKGVKADDLDYVMFKVSKLVDDKTDFTKAAEKFLKENPKYTGAGTYRVSTSTGSDNQDTGGSVNMNINDRIRAAARR